MKEQLVFSIRESSNNEVMISINDWRKREQLVFNGKESSSSKWISCYNESTHYNISQFLTNRLLNYEKNSRKRCRGGLSETDIMLFVIPSWEVGMERKEKDMEVGLVSSMVLFMWA